MKTLESQHPDFPQRERPDTDPGGPFWTLAGIADTMRLVLSEQIPLSTLPREFVDPKSNARLYEFRSPLTRAERGETLFGLKLLRAIRKVVLLTKQTMQLADWAGLDWRVMKTRKDGGDENATTDASWTDNNNQWLSKRRERLRSLDAFDQAFLANTRKTTIDMGEAGEIQATYVDMTVKDKYRSDLPAIVLIPSFEADPLCMEPLIRALALAGHRVVCLSYPGSYSSFSTDAFVTQAQRIHEQNISSKERAPEGLAPDFSLYVQYFKIFLAQFPDLGKSYLMGYSTGGTLVADMLSNDKAFSDRFDGAIAVASGSSVTQKPGSLENGVIKEALQLFSDHGELNMGFIAGKDWILDGLLKSQFAPIVLPSLRKILKLGEAWLRGREDRNRKIQEKRIQEQKFQEGDSEETPSDTQLSLASPLVLDQRLRRSLEDLQTYLDQELWREPNWLRKEQLAPIMIANLSLKTDKWPTAQINGKGKLVFVAGTMDDVTHATKMGDELGEIRPDIQVLDMKYTHSGFLIHAEKFVEELSQQMGW